MKLIIGLVGMLLPLLSAAQDARLRPLTVGDTVPDIVFNHIINYKASSGRLSDFSGKLVILDFWASWCTSCINGFPKADSLQRAFDSRLQILLVNPRVSRDSLRHVTRTLRRVKAKTGIDIQLPVILFDTTAFAYFPFRTLPNYVWISPEGIVRAITGKKELTAENIRLLLSGKAPGLLIKKDQLIKK